MKKYKIDAIENIKNIQKNDDDKILNNTYSGTYYGIMKYIKCETYEHIWYRYKILYTNDNFENVCKILDKIIIHSLHKSNKYIFYKVSDINPNIISYNIIVSSSFPYVKIHTKNFCLYYISNSFPYIKKQCKKAYVPYTTNKNMWDDILCNMELYKEYINYVEYINNLSSYDLFKHYNDIRNKKYNKKLLKKNRVKNTLIKKKLIILKNDAIT